MFCLKFKYEALIYIILLSSINKVLELEKSLEDAKKALPPPPPAPPAPPPPPPLTVMK
jgi:hypothetical protein